MNNNINNQVTVTSVDFLHPSIPESLHKAPENVLHQEYYSQLNPLWKNKRIPNTPLFGGITIGNYGCLLSCIATLFQIPPDKLAYDNPDCFQKDGSMLTDKLLARLGSTMVRQTTPEKAKTAICRTSFYSPKYPTHFYIKLANNSIIDPNNTYPFPNTTNKYANSTNEWRYCTNIKLI